MWTRVYTRNVGYDFALTAPGYDSPEEVWTALREEPDTAVISYFLAPSEAGGINFGDGQLELSGFFVEDEELPRDLFIEVGEPGTGEVRELRVIGVAEDTAYYPFTFGGEVVTSQGTVDDLAGGLVPAQSYLFDLEEGVGAAATARKLESGFVANGLQTTVLAEEIESQNAVNDIIQNLFTGFLALGLLVGHRGARGSSRPARSSSGGSRSGCSGRSVSSADKCGSLSSWSPRSSP